MGFTENDKSPEPHHEIRGFVFKYVSAEEQL
jgi:hypothetical protein